MSHTADSAVRPDPDTLLTSIADYVVSPPELSDEAMATARLCLMDSLGCAILALQYPQCAALVGPIVESATMDNGARVPGTPHRLEPVQAAWSFGAMVRWLDYNDTWLAAEWGHPSDNFGGILMVADYLTRNGTPVSVGDVLTAAIKAYEIQGVLALENSFNRVGLDHVLLVRIATTAVVTAMLGGTRQQVIDALSHAWIDGGALRTYRHAPNTGPRKSWAAGDATSRAVRLALITLKGQPGYPSAITARTWGFQDVLFDGKPVTLAQPLGSYVMENILFKVSFPAEFHAQTAVEAALQLHDQVKDRLDEIKEIRLHTQESAMRIISKTGPLNNYADRDHCLQYMAAIGLLHGSLTADHYLDDAANDPRVDKLRELMTVQEDPRYTKEYLDADKRSIGNAIQVFFKDGTSTEKVAVEYPVGHRRRREEAKPLLKEKFLESVANRYDSGTREQLLAMFDDPAKLDAMSASDFVDAYCN